MWQGPAWVVVGGPPPRGCVCFPEVPPPPPPVGGSRLCPFTAGCGHRPISSSFWIMASGLALQWHWVTLAMGTVLRDTVSICVVIPPVKGQVPPSDTVSVPVRVPVPPQGHTSP